MSEQPKNAAMRSAAIERAAAEWSLRLRSGVRDEAHREFEAWLHRDPRHAEIFAEMDETSRLLDQLRDPALAAPNVVPFEEPLVVEHPAASARRRWLLPVAMVAAFMLMAGLVGVRVWEARENYTAAFATDVGARRTVNLPDGSVLQLNTDSVVEANYSANDRRVRLKQGEAFFSVAKNRQRPFWVDVDGVSVRAIGTAFNVRFRAQSVEVLVKEGKVSVNPTLAAPAVAGTAPAPASAHFVVAGEQAKVALPAKGSAELRPVVVAPVAAPRLENALAWQEGRLQFTDTPLAEVVAEFNRYNRHQLTISDPALAAEPFGGSFTAGGYEAFVEVLEQSFGVVAERGGSETILRRSPATTRTR